jgi:hypothetical protein
VDADLAVGLDRAAEVGRADDQVGPAVAVDVAERVDRVARAVGLGRVDRVEHRAAGARQQGQPRGRGAAAAEAAVEAEAADRDVEGAVAVEVADAADRPADAGDARVDVAEQGGLRQGGRGEDQGREEGAHRVLPVGDGSIVPLPV